MLLQEGIRITNVLTFNRLRSFVTQAIRQIFNEEGIQTTSSKSFTFLALEHLVYADLPLYSNLELQHAYLT